MTLKVHHLTVSQSERIVWLCEELGIDYELVVYERSPIFAPPEYKALHPLGSAPVIQDGDLIMAESGACVEYICHKYGNGRFIVGPSEKNYADYIYWFHFANATLQATLMRSFTFKTAGLPEDSPVVQRMVDLQTDILRFVDDRLSRAKYLAGDDFTAADIMSVVCFTSMRCYNGYSLKGFDNILAYLKRIAARDSYQRALKKGDPELDVNLLIGEAAPPLQKGVAERFPNLNKT